MHNENQFHKTQAALEQINAICKTIENNLKIIISGSLTMALGIFIICFKLTECFFNYIVCKFLSGPFSSVISFLLIIIALVVISYLLSKCFDLRMHKNPVLEKIFTNFGLFFIILSALTSEALTVSGNDALVTPIGLILVGTLVAFWGLFSSIIVRFTAYNLVLVGATGIWLTKFNIAHLSTYLIIYQGLSFIVMGYLLNKEAQ